MDKIDRLLDAMEHPESYSDSEIENMLHDPEVLEVYSLLDRTKSSLTTIDTPDIDAEWKEFERIHNRRRFSILSFLSRNVAASIAIGIVSFAAVATVVGVSVNYVFDKKADVTVAGIVTETKENAETNDTIAAVGEAPAIVPETVVFNNEPLETIANRIAAYYGCKVVFSSEATRTLRLYFRWNQAQTLDEVVESLNNFEQIHISVTDRTLKID